jgi:phosphoglycerate dehydrogenase-like enzyme
VTPSRRPVVVVLGATEQDPPPGIGAAGERADLVFAPDLPALREAIGGAEVVFAWRGNVDGPLLPPVWRATDALRWIQTPSDGVDGLLFPDLVASDVIVTNARGVFDDAVAEHAIALALVMAKGLDRAVQAQADGRWDRRDTELLSGRRMLIVGVGPIGRRIARIAGALGMAVRGLGRSPRSVDPDLGRIDGIDALHEALAWSDVVVDCLPGTERTRHVFDAAAFAAMGEHAWFVNVGRGSTVDEPALVGALRAGSIRAAALDVFEEEPLPSQSPLWSLPNALVSPHVAGDYAGWRHATVALFVENLTRYVDGRPLRNVVDKGLGFPPGDG